MESLLFLRRCYIKTIEQGINNVIAGIVILIGVVTTFIIV